MKMCLNESAFDGSSSDKDETLALLKSLTDNAYQSRMLRNHKQPLRTADFKERLVHEGKTIQQFFYELQKSKIPEERKLSQFMLTNLLKSPYIREFSTIVTLVDNNGVCYLHSSLHYVVDDLISRCLISPDLPQLQQDTLVLNSGDNQYQLNNFYSKQQININTWIYEDSAKHQIPKDIFVDGNVWSAMGLSNKQAQTALSNSIGIKGKRCTYSCFNGIWYQFYNHTNNLYHGFPIENNGNNADLNKIIKYVGNSYTWDLGQINI